MFMQSTKSLHHHRGYKLSEWEISRVRIITLSLHTGHEGTEEIMCPNSHQSLQLNWKNTVQCLNNSKNIYCPTSLYNAKKPNSIISVPVHNAWRAMCRRCTHIQQQTHSGVMDVFSSGVPRSQQFCNTSTGTLFQCLWKTFLTQVLL